MPEPSILARRSQNALSPSQSDKVAFLSKPENYPEHTKNVTVIQTHHAWVFLTDKYAYKMKKPTRLGRYDNSSLDTRHYLCAEEFRLNRRLARQTYINILPLVVGHDQKLTLDADGTVVEWLVKMHRLPRERMLSSVAPKGLIRDDDIHRLMRKLQRFYSQVPVCDLRERSYASRLQNQIRNTDRDLVKSEYRFPLTLVTEIVSKLMRYIETHSQLLEARQRDGYIREVHGDLRPEHICFLPDVEPEIIDCLEFDRDLRCLDCAEEIAYLGLECRAIGQQRLEEKIIALYRSSSGDVIPMHLWHFYAARRAIVRAKLCARHTIGVEDGDEWLQLGKEYLEFALHYLDNTSIS